MTADSDKDLWTAFQRAKDALLSSLEASLPDAEHLLLTPAAVRGVARASLQHEIDRRKIGLHRIRSVQKALSVSAKRITKLRERAQTLMAPCTCLPVEILREVFLYALQPEDPVTTIRVSSVCSSWRAMALNEPSLFSQADWNNWPPWLLEEWCSRAQSHPLHISVEDGYLRRNGLHGRANPYRPIMKATKPVWNSLHLTLKGVHREACESFLRNTLPSLRSLHIRYSPQDWKSTLPGFVVKVDIPNVQIVNIDGLALQPKSPLTKLAEISLTPPYEETYGNTYYSAWVAILRLSPALVNLTITSNGKLALDLQEPMVVIPTLESLVLEHKDSYDEDIMASFTSLLRLWSLPNLRHLRTRIDDPVRRLEEFDTRDPEADFLDALTLCAPRLETFEVGSLTGSFQDYCFGEMIMKTLARDIDALRFVPMLDELHFVGFGYLDLGDSEYEDWYEAVIRSLAKRPRMRRLSVPLLSHACSEELSGDLESLKVWEYLEEDMDTDEDVREVVLLTSNATQEEFATVEPGWKCWDESLGDSFAILYQPDIILN